MSPPIRPDPPPRQDPQNPPRRPSPYAPNPGETHNTPPPENPPPNGNRETQPNPPPRTAPPSAPPTRESAPRVPPKDGVGAKPGVEGSASQDVFRSAGPAGASTATSQEVVRGILSETHPLARSLEHLGRMLFSSGAVRTQQAAIFRAAEVRGQVPATLELPFQGIVKMLSSRGPLLTDSLQAKPPSSSAETASTRVVAHSVNPDNVQGQTSLQAIRQTLFQSLGAFLTANNVSSQLLSKSTFQELSRFLPLPFFQEGLLLSRFLGGKEVSVVLGLPSRAFAPETQGLVKTFLQGLTHYVENPAAKGFTSGNMPALLRTLFGLFLIKGTEVQIRSTHSALLDELGALLSRSARRTRKKDRRRIGRADRVQRKDKNLPVDPDLQDGDETLIDDIDSWLNSPSNAHDEAEGFSFYLQ